MLDCISKVKEKHPDADGFTMRLYNGCTIDEDEYCYNCFAEYNMDDWNDSKKHLACIFSTEGNTNSKH